MKRDQEEARVKVEAEKSAEREREREREARKVGGECSEGEGSVKCLKNSL